VTVSEDSGYYVGQWASSISPGPANEASQTVGFDINCDNRALFSASPQLSSTGVLTFTPASHAFGSSSCSVVLTDSEGGLVGPEQLAIVVTAGTFIAATLLQAVHKLM
jgi:hypothetical protein